MNLLKKIIEKIQNPRDTIETRTIVEEENFCPSHYIPHKFPDRKPITDEPCHFHTSYFNQYFHHQIFCILKCPNYKLMSKA